MKIDCIADLHGHFPKLEGGDLLIVAGDLTARDTQDEHIEFSTWLSKQNYHHKILIAGNHDNQLILLNGPISVPRFDYLLDSGTEFEGLKIWGSPWTKTFPGMNPHCKAFTVDTEEELTEKWALIPDDIDILITHAPPFGILDLTQDWEKVGSKSLLKKTLEIKAQLHCFGHIHECGGQQLDSEITTFVNASIVNERYEHVNKPMRVNL